jgi:diacylglycerol kinase family enzyme
MALLNSEIMNQQYQAYADGKDFSGRYCNIHINNGPCDGNIMVPSPYAKANDGLLDVIFAESGKKMAVFKTLTDYFNGKFEKYDMYSRMQCKKIELKSSVPIRIQMDGEAFFADEITVEILPNHVKFIVPQGIEFVDYSHRAYGKKRNADNGK